MAKFKSILEAFNEDVLDDEIEKNFPDPQPEPVNPEPMEETEPEVTEVPETPIEEPVKPEEAPTDQNIIKNAYTDQINGTVQKSWDLISELNSVIASIDYQEDCPSKEDVKTIINSVVDEYLISIGMLNKVLTLIDSKTGDLLDTGEDKATELITD